MGLNIIDDAGKIGEICEKTKSNVANFEKLIDLILDNSKSSNENTLKDYLEVSKLEDKDIILKEIEGSSSEGIVPVIKRLRNESLLSGLEQISVASKSILQQRDFKVVENQISYIKSIINSQPDLKSINSFCRSQIDSINKYVGDRASEKSAVYSQEHLEESPKEQQRQARRGIKETMRSSSARSNFAKEKKENEEMIRREQRLAKRSLRDSEHVEAL